MANHERRLHAPHPGQPGRKDAKSAFARFAPQPYSGFIPLAEAAARIGTTPAAIDDIFRSRKDTQCTLRFEFEEREVRIVRRKSRPSLIPDTSIVSLRGYVKAKKTVAGRDFAPIGYTFTRLQRNMRMVSAFVRSNVQKLHGTPYLYLLPDSNSKDFRVEVHELKGTIYCRPSDAPVIMFCARMLYGGRRTASITAMSLVREASSYDEWADFPKELAMKLWIAREIFSSSDFKETYSDHVHSGYARFFSEKKIEAFFSRSSWGIFLKNQD